MGGRKLSTTSVDAMNTSESTLTVTKTHWINRIIPVVWRANTIIEIEENSAARRIGFLIRTRQQWYEQML